MLTEIQRRQVWESWLSAEIRANYFADLAGRYHQLQRWATWAILFSSSGAFVTWTARVPEPWNWLAPVLALATAGLSLYSLVAQHQKHAMDAADLHARWNRLASDHERLWDDMYAEDAPARLSALIEREAELGKVATAFPVNEKRLLKWQDHVEKHHRLAA